MAEILNALSFLRTRESIPVELLLLPTDAYRQFLLLQTR